MQKGKIYRRGSWWMFRYKLPVMVAGKKVWKDRYEKLAPVAQYSSAAALEKDNLLAQFRPALDTSTTTASTMQLMTDFAEHIYFPAQEAKLKASTLAGYRNLFKCRFAPHVSGKRMIDFTPRVAQHFLDDIAAVKPLSARTLQHIKWFGVGIFDHAKLVGAYPDVYENPFRRIKIPKSRAQATPTRYATTEQVVDMIAILPEPAATVIALAAFTGLRKSEIQGLKWEDLRDGELHIVRSAWRTTTLEETKTAASAAPVPVIPMLAKHLAAHRNGFPAEGFIFTGAKTGRPLDLHNLANRVICPALKKEGIPWPGFHGFRRGLATNLKTLGIDDAVIQRVLRHADVSVTRQSYIKIEDVVKTAAMKKLQRSLAAKIKSRKSRKNS